jgi:hypothetical protein
VCNTGRLEFHSEQHFLNPDSEAAVRAYRANLDAKSELSGHFTGSLKCADESCGAQVAMAGDYAHSYSDDRDTDWSAGRPTPEFTEYFRVKFLTPAPTLIEAPEKTPPEIVSPILEASRSFWISPGLAANLLRQAVERVLDEQGIASRNANGAYLSTQNRIDQYKKMKPALAELLEATKWIGNSGSHDLDLTSKEVLGGAEYLERVLAELYAAPELLARARAVNTAKGPVR